MPSSLHHEERESGDALSTLLASYPYDSISRYAVNEGFNPENPEFRLVGVEETMNDNMRFGTGANCLILPEILRRRLETRGLSGKLLADEDRSHVVLCIPGENGTYVICDPGLLCVRPFVVTPDQVETAVQEVDNPGGNDRFGFRATFRPDERRLLITKDKAKSGTRVTYNFDLARLGDLDAVRATNIKDTLTTQIPLISKLVMPKIGTVAAVDSVSVRDNRGKVREFAHRTGIDATELWRRLDVGNQVRRVVQSVHQNGKEIKWTE